MNIEALQSFLNQVGAVLSMYPKDSLWIKAIPTVISVFNELIMFGDAREVEERLSLIEAKVEDLGIEKEFFKESLNSLDHHNRYAFRKFLKHYCLETLPEVTDAMIYSMIDFATSQEKGINEEVCEILQQFNAIDIECMKRIKDILEDDEITQKRQIEAQTKIEEQKYSNWQDSVFYYPGLTVLWNDFINVRIGEINSEGKIVEKYPDSTEMMIHNYSKNGVEIKLSQYPRSIIKLQGLGVLITYSESLLGISPEYNIKQFTLTKYGVKILEYIK